MPPVVEGAWVDAKAALYVLGSEIEGRDGPAGSRAVCRSRQGRCLRPKNMAAIVVSFDEVSPDFVFAEIEPDPDDTGDKL